MIIKSQFYKKTCHVTSAGSGKIWILVADWSRVKSSEPNAGDVTRKIGPLYFTIIKKNWLSFYPSEPFTLDHSTMRHPVVYMPWPRVAFALLICMLGITECWEIRNQRSNRFCLFLNYLSRPMTFDLPTYYLPHIIGSLMTLGLWMKPIMTDNMQISRAKATLGHGMYTYYRVSHSAMI